MKIIAYIVITLSVIAGSLASSTAYLVRLDGASPEALNGLRLGSPAGAYAPSEVDAAFLERLASVRRDIDAQREVTTNPLKPAEPVRPRADVPTVETEATGESVLRERESMGTIARAGDTLTPELVALLSQSGVTYVKVTEFSVFRWTYAWLFGLSCVGLGAGAMMIRAARRNALAKLESERGADEAETTDARAVIARLSGRLHTLADELASETDEQARLQAILLHVGEIQRDDVPAFAADRAALVNRLSLAGYAELMDCFAAMERQLNRAWSSAADAHLAESEACLRNAQPLLLETLERMREPRSPMVEAS